jgi:transcriptional regulator with XRE-family HTH domain
MTLSRKFRTELVKRSESYNELAKRIGMSASTLRTWLSRNRWPEAGAVTIARALGMTQTAKELKDQYDIGKGWATAKKPRNGLPPLDALRGAFKDADARCAKMRTAFDAVTRDLERCCRAMRKDDLRILLSASVKPIEFEEPPAGDAMREAIAEGIYGGGTFLYLRPIQELMDDYDTVWHFERYLNQEEIEKRLNVFREYVIAYLIDKKNMPQEEARERAILVSPARKPALNSSTLIY